MSHLGDRVTPLVDQQLPGDVAERAHVHLAACEECREAVEVERLTKARLAMLGSPQPDQDLMRRLLQMAGPAGPMPPRAGHVPGSPRSHAVRPTAVAAAAPRAGGPPATRPANRHDAAVGPFPTRPSRRSRTRLTAALVGAVCLVGVGVAGGLVTVGGAQQPTIVPPVDTFVVEHNATTTSLPFGAPSTVRPTAGGR